MFMDRRRLSDGAAAASQYEFRFGIVPVSPGGGQREDGIGRSILPQGCRHGPFGPRGGGGRRKKDRGSTLRTAAATEEMRSGRNLLMT